MIKKEIIADVPGKTGRPWTEETSPDIYDKIIAYTKISNKTPGFNQSQHIEQNMASNCEILIFVCYSKN
jgi:hypothetical protein